jgi:hypothetical protein
MGRLSGVPKVITLSPCDASLLHVFLANENGAP